MTCHFALPFIAWLWEDEVTIQVLRRQKEEKIRLPNDEKKRLFGIGELAKASTRTIYSTPYELPAARGLSADALCVIVHEHKSSILHEKRRLAKVLG